MTQSPLVVRVTSAVALSESQITELVTAIKKKYEVKTVDISNSIDADVLGGLKLTINSTEFDATLQSKLNKLKYQLKESNS